MLLLPSPLGSSNPPIWTGTAFIFHSKDTPLITDFVNRINTGMNLKLIFNPHLLNVYQKQNL